MEAEKKDLNSKVITEKSFTNRLSYSLGGFLDNFFSAAFTIRVIGYYEDEILLPIVLVSLSFVIYGLWNMFNDPLIGFFTDRNTKITRRWGRRFPWYMIAVIPFTIFYLLIFTVPFYSTVLIFLWLLFCICMFDFYFHILDYKIVFNLGYTEGFFSFNLEVFIIENWGLNSCFTIIFRLINGKKRAKTIRLHLFSH